MTPGSLLTFARHHQHQAQSRLFFTISDCLSAFGSPVCNVVFSIDARLVLSSSHSWTFCDTASSLTPSTFVLYSVVTGPAEQFSCHWLVYKLDKNLNLLSSVENNLSNFAKERKICVILWSSKDSYEQVTVVMQCGNNKNKKLGKDVQDILCSCTSVSCGVCQECYVQNVS